MELKIYFQLLRQNSLLFPFVLWIFPNSLNCFMELHVPYCGKQLAHTISIILTLLTDHSRSGAWISADFGSHWMKLRWWECWSSFLLKEGASSLLLLCFMTLRAVMWSQPASSACSSGCKAEERRQQSTLQIKSLDLLFAKSFFFLLFVDFINYMFW